MDGRGTFHSVLRRRDFRRVLVGLAVSEAGDWLYNVALLVFILNRTHSGSWVAAATVARLSPYVIVGPLGGLLAERHDYRRVMIGSDLIRAALMGALALLAAVHGPPVGALALVFFSTSAGCAYVPAVTAMTPSIVSESEFAAANALIQTVANIAIVVGPAFGALLLLLGSPWAAFLRYRHTLRVDRPRRSTTSGVDLRPFSFAAYARHVGRPLGGAALSGRTLH